MILANEFQIEWEIQQIRHMEWRSNSEYILVAYFNDFTDHRHCFIFIQVVAFVGNRVEINLKYTIIPQHFHIHNLTQEFILTESITSVGRSCLTCVCARIS